MSKDRSKLFRAIVVMGAALTAPACGDDGPSPVPSDAAQVADADVRDAGVADSSGPADTPVDVVLIL